ncbi:MAG: CCA tRNA nucleotidyltransferase [Gemmatimonadales bacterium]|nr:CCA tRNA nucleotidyltransferase [Gemmatimonadales bacterium]
MSFPERLEVPEEVLEIARTLERAGHEAWCVGGALRDALLHNPHSDYDFATSARPEEVQALFRRTAAVGVKYGTVGVLDRHRVLHEVTTFRRDVATDGRHAVVEYGVTLEDDLARRDFTINAIAYHPLRHEWRDPFDGAQDLARGVVRAVGDPAERFREDYLRILRAVRFAARFGFTIEPDTWLAANAAAPGITRLSAERVRDEWLKGLGTARNVTELVRLWTTIGAAAIWLPELGDAETVPPPADAVAAPRDAVLLTILLTRDPEAALRRLKASNSDIRRAAAAAAGPESPAASDPVAVRRWLSAVGGAANDLLALWTLRHAREPEWAQPMRAVRERGDPLSRTDLAITGRDLQAIGASGRRIGEILGLLLERVLAAPELNSRDALLALAREKL